MSHDNWTYYDFLEAIKLERHDPEYVKKLTGEMNAKFPQKKEFYVRFFGQKQTDIVPKSYKVRRLAYTLDDVKNYVFGQYQNVTHFRQVNY